jgi:DNA-binding winged helix-turn-helix (wHTH) protein
LATPGAHSADRLRRYTFGEFTLDLDAGFLRRGTEEVALRPKPFEVLAYLVQHHGRLVSKSELADAVWPDTAVMDNSLAQCLVEVRRALGDESQQVIRTVARRGYMFAAPVTMPLVEFPLALSERSESKGRLPSRTNRPRVQTHAVIAVALVILAVVAVTVAMLRSTRPRTEDLTYTQLTNFTDSAVSPALSPDGRMVAFIRSDNWFLTADQIYVKLLPNGDPVQLTRDPRPKYGPAFSPDGTRIVYTVFPWSTYVISPLGGEPRLLLANSSGVTWLDHGRILFSEVNHPPRSNHMGVVTALEDRSEQRTIYFPADERGMVHVSYASPDREWILVLEMNPIWQPCHVVPFDGRSAGRQVGPRGKCTTAGGCTSASKSTASTTCGVSGSRTASRNRSRSARPKRMASPSRRTAGR